MSINNIVSNIQAGQSMIVSSGALDVSHSFLNYMRVSFTNTNVNQIKTTPIRIIPGTNGFLYVIDSCALAMNGAELTLSFSGGGNTYLQYGNLTSSNNVCSQSISASQIHALQDNSIITIPGGYPVNISSSDSTFWGVNVGASVYLTNDTSDFSGGDDTSLTLHVWYRALTFIA